MIKITKHSVESKRIAVKFICDCGCEFWADNNSLLSGKEKKELVIIHCIMQYAQNVKRKFALSIVQ